MKEDMQKIIEIVKSKIKINQIQKHKMNKKAIITIAFSFILLSSIIIITTNNKENLDISNKKNKTIIRIETKESLSIGKIEINGTDVEIENSNGFFKDLYRIEKTNLTTTLKFFSLQPKYTHGELKFNKIEKINEIKMYDKNGKIIESLVWNIH
ncbi:MAG: hypothetical protein PHT94_04365 [Candidatus Nanoarchaeia archaeon]|nr:hypothetical protein [Candidatus Nanoarchaeia archaeon]